MEEADLAEAPKNNLLEERHQLALEIVRRELEKDDNFQAVPVNEANSPLKFTSAIWRTHIHALDKDWLVDIGLPRRFPDETPIAYVSDWQQLFLRNPHVVKGGLLCVIPGSAAINSSDPVGLIRYVHEKAKEILEGTSAEDFKEEFSYYWSRCSTEGAQDVLIIDPIFEIEKSFPAIFCQGYVCVASSLERLNRWVTNFIGKTSELTNEKVGISINLECPLLPNDYPNTLENLISLSAANDASAAQLIKNHVVNSSAKALALLVQKEGEGVALGGIIFSGLGFSQSKSPQFTKGFRSGTVPEDLLFSRAAHLMRSTNVSRSKVINVDHRWIHSRGGDGKDLSKKAVLLIGCGSLGGYVAHLLCRAGVGRLTITDNDRLGWENLGRHILGASSIGQWKAEALAEQLKGELPHLQITGIAKDWRDVYESSQNIFNEHNLVISTVADWRCEGPLNYFKRKIEMPPLLLGWLEPHAVAGHCLVISHEGGCFECAANEFGQFNHNVANFVESTICREPGGCAHYQHYGPTALMPVASMIATVVVESLLNLPTESFLNTWISSKEHLDSVGATLTEIWSREVDVGGFSKTFKKIWKKSDSCHLCVQKNS